MKSVSGDYTTYEATNLDFITKRRVKLYDDTVLEADISDRIISVSPITQKIEETLGDFDIGECEIIVDDTDGYFLGSSGKLVGCSELDKWRITIEEGYEGVSDYIKTFEGFIPHYSIKKMDNYTVGFKVSGLMQQLQLVTGNDCDEITLKKAVKDLFDKKIDTYDIETPHIPTYSGGEENFVETTVTLPSGEIGRDFARKTYNWSAHTAEYYAISDSRLYKFEFDESEGKVFKMTQLKDFSSYLESASGDWGDERLAEMFFNADQSYCYISTVRPVTGLYGNDGTTQFDCDVVWTLFRYNTSTGAHDEYVLDHHADLGGADHHVLWNLGHAGGDIFYFYILHSSGGGSPNYNSIGWFSSGTLASLGVANSNYMYGSCVYCKLSGQSEFLYCPSTNPWDATSAMIPWRKYLLPSIVDTGLTGLANVDTYNDKNCFPYIGKLVGEGNIYATIYHSTATYFYKYDISEDTWTWMYPNGGDQTKDRPFHIDPVDASHFTLWRANGLKRKSASEELSISNTDGSDAADATNLLKAWVIQVSDKEYYPTYDEYVWAYTTGNTLKIVRHGDEAIPHITKDYTGKTALAALTEMARNFNCLMFIRPKTAGLGSYGWFGYRDRIKDWESAGEILLDDNEIEEKEEFDCWEYYAKRVEYTAGATTSGYGDAFPTNVRTLKFSSSVLADAFSDDMAKYLYSYFHVVRRVVKVKFKKPHFHYEMFDYIKISDKKHIMIDMGRERVLESIFLQMET